MATKKHPPTSVKIPESQDLKAKYIAWFNKASKHDTVLKFVDKGIADFEAEHGEITTKKLEQGRII